MNGLRQNKTKATSKSAHENLSFVAFACEVALYHFLPLRAR
jgi:hypothetical protein